MAEEATGAEAIISDEAQLDTLREGIDDPQVLKAQLAKEAEARRQLTARAKKAEDLAKTEREARIRAEESAKSNITNQTSSPIVEDERFELRMTGYSKSDVDFIMANGGSKVLEDPNNLVTIAVKARKEQLAAEAAASQTGTSGGEDRLSTVNFNLPRNASLKDLKGSLETMEKVLPHAD